MKNIKLIKKNTILICKKKRKKDIKSAIKSKKVTPSWFKCNHFIRFFSVFVRHIAKLLAFIVFAHHSKRSFHSETASLCCFSLYCWCFHSPLSSHKERFVFFFFVFLLFCQICVRFTLQ